MLDDIFNIDITNLSDQFSTIESDINKVKSGFSNLSSDAQAKITKMVKAAKTYGKSISSINDVYGNLGASGAASLNKLINYLLDTTKSVKETKAIMEEMGVSGRFVSESIDKANKSMSGFSSSLGKARGQMRGMVGILGSGTVAAIAYGGALGEITKVTAKYQKEIYNAVRASQILGQSHKSAIAGLRGMAAATGLNEQAAAKFYQTYLSVSNGIAPTTGKMVAFVKSIGDEFGKTEEDINRFAQQFGKLQSLQIGINLDYLDDLKNGLVDSYDVANKLANMKILGVDQSTINSFLRLRDSANVKEETKSLKNMSDLVAHLDSMISRFVAQNGDKLKKIISSFAKIGEMVVNVFSKIPSSILSGVVALKLMQALVPGIVTSFTNLYGVVAKAGAGIKNAFVAAATAKTVAAGVGDKKPKGIFSALSSSLTNGVNKCLPVCGSGVGGHSLPSNKQSGIRLKPPKRAGSSLKLKSPVSTIEKNSKGFLSNMSSLFGLFVGKLKGFFKNSLKSLAKLRGFVKNLTRSFGPLLVGAASVAASFLFASKIVKKRFGKAVSDASEALEKSKIAQQAGKAKLAKKEGEKVAGIRKNTTMGGVAIGGGIVGGALAAATVALTASFIGIATVSLPLTVAIGALVGLFGGLIVASKESAKLTKDDNLIKMNNQALQGRLKYLTKQEIAAIQKKNEATIDEIKAAKYGSGMWGDFLELVDRDMPFVSDSIKKIGDWASNLTSAVGPVLIGALGAFADVILNIVNFGGISGEGVGRDTYADEMKMNSSIVSDDKEIRKLKAKIKTADLTMAESSGDKNTVAAIQKDRDRYEKQIESVMLKRNMKKLMLTSGKFSAEKKKYLESLAGGSSENSAIIASVGPMGKLLKEAKGMVKEEKKRFTTIANITREMRAITTNYENQSKILGKMLSVNQAIYNLSLKTTESGLTEGAIKKTMALQDSLVKKSMEARSKLKDWVDKLKKAGDVGERKRIIAGRIHDIQSQIDEIGKNKGKSSVAKKKNLEDRKDRLKEMQNETDRSKQLTMSQKMLADLTKAVFDNISKRADTENLIGSQLDRRKSLLKSNLDLGRQELELTKSFMSGAGLTYEMQMEQLGRVRKMQAVVAEQAATARDELRKRGKEEKIAEQKYQQLKKKGMAEDEAKLKSGLLKAQSEEQQSLLTLNKYKMEGLQLSKEEIDLTKELRFGYLSAMKSQAMASGTFAKILFSRDQNLSKMLENRSDEMKRSSKEVPGWGQYVGPLGGRLTKNQAARVRGIYSGGFSQFTATGFRGSGLLTKVASPWYAGSTQRTFEERFGRSGRGGAAAVAGGYFASGVVANAQQRGVLILNAMQEQVNGTRAVTTAVNDLYNALTRTTNYLNEKGKVAAQAERRNNNDVEIGNDRPARSVDYGRWLNVKNWFKAIRSSPNGPPHLYSGGILPLKEGTISGNTGVTGRDSTLRRASDGFFITRRSESRKPHKARVLNDINAGRYDSGGVVALADGEFATSSRHLNAGTVPLLSAVNNQNISDASFRGFSNGGGPLMDAFVSMFFNTGESENKRKNDSKDFSDFIPGLLRMFGVLMPNGGKANKVNKKIIWGIRKGFSKKQTAKYFAAFKKLSRLKQSEIEKKEAKLLISDDGNSAQFVSNSDYRKTLRSLKVGVFGTEDRKKMRNKKLDQIIIDQYRKDKKMLAKEKTFGIKAPRMWKNGGAGSPFSGEIINVMPEETVTSSKRFKKNPEVLSLLGAINDPRVSDDKFRGFAKGGPKNRRGTAVRAPARAASLSTSDMNNLDGNKQYFSQERREYNDTITKAYKEMTVAGILSFDPLVLVAALIEDVAIGHSQSVNEKKFAESDKKIRQLKMAYHLGRIIRQNEKKFAITSKDKKGDIKTKRESFRQAIGNARKIYRREGLLGPVLTNKIIALYRKKGIKRKNVKTTPVKNKKFDFFDRFTKMRVLGLDIASLTGDSTISRKLSRNSYFSKKYGPDKFMESQKARYKNEYLDMMDYLRRGIKKKGNEGEIKKIWMKIAEEKRLGAAKMLNRWITYSKKYPLGREGPRRSGKFYAEALGAIAYVRKNKDKSEAEKAKSILFGRSDKEAIKFRNKLLKEYRDSFKSKINKSLDKNGFDNKEKEYFWNLYKNKRNGKKKVSFKVAKEAYRETKRIWPTKHLLDMYVESDNPDRYIVAKKDNLISGVKNGISLDSQLNDTRMGFLRGFDNNDNNEKNKKKSITVSQVAKRYRDNEEIKAERAMLKNGRANLIEYLRKNYRGEKDIKKIRNIETLMKTRRGRSSEGLRNLNKLIERNDKYIKFLQNKRNKEFYKNAAKLLAEMKKKGNSKETIKKYEKIFFGKDDVKAKSTYNKINRYVNVPYPPEGKMNGGIIGSSRLISSYASEGFPGHPKGIDTERYMLSDGDVVLNREATNIYRDTHGRVPGKMVTPSGGRVNSIASGNQPFFVASGEAVIPAKEARSIGYGALTGMNDLGNSKKTKAGRMASGGIVGNINKITGMEREEILAKNIVQMIASQNVMGGFASSKNIQHGANNNVTIGGITIGYQQNINKSKEENDDALIESVLVKVGEELRDALIKEQKKRVI